MRTAPLTTAESVCERLIGRVYSSHEPGLPEFVSEMPEEERVNVALLCYGRVHLREIALAIAATCDRGALIEAAGKIMGDILFTQSRQSPVPVKQRSAYRRPPITVASLASVAASDPAAQTAAFEPEDGDEEEAFEADEQGTVENVPE
jgi:hypothetical protein